MRDAITFRMTMCPSLAEEMDFFIAEKKEGISRMIQLQNVRKEYIVDKKSVTALKQIDLHIEKGEIFGVIGHSGAGKSTLIRCINLLETPTHGSVIVDGVDLTKLKSGQLQEARRHIGMIFQHFNLLSSATIYENIALPLRLAKKSSADIERKVSELLDLVGLSEHRNKYPSQLSGGQKQRVGIARALANDPKVLLCDEATSALDPMTTQSILELLADINRRLGLTIVLITHEMHVIQEICDRVAVIEGGEIAEIGPVIEVFLKPQQPITKDFVGQVNEVEIPKQILDQYDQTECSPGSHHHLVVVSFLGETTLQPVMFQILQQHKLEFNILHGTISRLKQTPYGRLVLDLTGQEHELKEALEAIRERGLDLEVIR